MTLQIGPEQSHTLLVAGAGYVGMEILRRVPNGPHKKYTRAVGLRRSPQSGTLDIRSVDLLSRQSLLELSHTLSHPVDLVYAASPGGRSESAYRAAYVDGLENALRAFVPHRVILLSSSGVVVRNDGSFVDERTPLVATGFVPKALMDAEAIVRAYSRSTNRSGAVLRLGGIYGPTRTRLIDQVRRGEFAVPDTPIYTNRIHRDDAARAALFLLLRSDLNGAFFGVDDDCATLREVGEWLATKLGAPAISSGPSSRRSNKRVSNARLRRAGFRFVYPSFRDGYAAMLEGASKVDTSKQ